MFQHLREKLVNMHLIQTIEDNHGALFEVKGFLSKLKKPEAHDSIVNFVLDFEPYLEQTTQISRLKKESASRLDQLTKAMFHQWDLVSLLQKI